MYDYKYSISIMEEQLRNKYISPEIRYAFKASIEALEKQIKLDNTPPRDYKITLLDRWNKQELTGNFPNIQASIDFYAEQLELLPKWFSFIKLENL